MTRKVIYIKNPKSGSNFRTIGGGGSVPTRSTPKRAPKNTITESMTADEWNRQYYKQVESGWKIRNPAPKLETTSYRGVNFNGPNFGMVSAPVGPAFVNFEALTREQFYQLRWQNTTVWTAFYDIARGIVPQSGARLAPFGTAGTLMIPNPFAPPGHSDNFFGGELAKLPSVYTTQPTDDQVYDAYIASLSP